MTSYLLEQKIELVKDILQEDLEVFVSLMHYEQLKFKTWQQMDRQGYSHAQIVNVLQPVEALREFLFQENHYLNKH